MNLLDCDSFASCGCQSLALYSYFLLFVIITPVKIVSNARQQMYLFVGLCIAPLVKLPFFFFLLCENFCCVYIVYVGILFSIVQTAKEEDFRNFPTNTSESSLNGKIC